MSATPNQPPTPKDPATPKGPESAAREPTMTAAQSFLLEDDADKKILRIAFIPAIVFHFVLFIITFPTLSQGPQVVAQKPKVYVVQQVRFKPPPPQEEQQLPKPKSKKVPIPDPTPDEPEPIRIEEPEDIDIPVDADDLIIGIPEAPPALDTGPIYVTGDVQKPEKLNAPQPQYTEIARKARIQGVVILQAIINEQGDVVNVTVLKGLPMGLSEAAESAVVQWKFKPATLNGKPVAVYFNLTVNFQLQ